MLELIAMSPLPESPADAAQEADDEEQDEDLNRANNLNDRYCNHQHHHCCYYCYYYYHNNIYIYSTICKEQDLRSKLNTRMLVVIVVC